MDQNSLASVSPSARLAGKVAVITGTGSGQGREAALLFASEGATVLGCDLNADAAAETDALARDRGLHVSSQGGVDLGDDIAVGAWIDKATADVGRIDILYNNAAVARFGTIEEASVADWKFTIRNELDIPFLVTRHAWPHLARQGGSIVNIASTAAIRGSVLLGRAAHSAAKAGLAGLSLQLAAEGARWGIRSNAIFPGPIATPQSLDAIFSDPHHPMAQIGAHIPLGRVGVPRDVVRAALFFASDESSYITGAELVVDGGLSAILPGATPDIAYGLERRIAPVD